MIYYKTITVRQQQLNGTVRVIKDTVYGCSKEELHENIRKRKAWYRDRIVESKISIGLRIVSNNDGKVRV